MALSDMSDLEWELTKGVLPNKTRGKKRVDAVRIALPSALTRKQVASDLGIGLSTLNKWITTHRDTDVVSDKDLDLACENEWLRRENRILKEERDILKRPRPSSRAKSQKVLGRRVEKQRWPSSSTSTASTIRVGGTQPWAGKVRSPSNGKWPKRALGAAQKRDRSKVHF